MNNCDLRHIAELFNIEGSVLGVTPTGNGHINDTYLVVTEFGRYILQRINTHVFRSPDQLMHNIKAVTDYIEGDHYFKTKYPEHNLIRCRAQFRLVKEMEKHWEEMRIPRCK